MAKIICDWKLVICLEKLVNICVCAILQKGMKKGMKKGTNEKLLSTSTDVEICRLT